MAAKRINITGKRNGRLVVVRYLFTHKRRTYWWFRCDCGRERCFTADQIKFRESCGCLHRERRLAAVTTHGMHKHKAYRVWVGLRERCNNPKNEGYSSYGGRGITVCEEWDRDFAAFWRDMGSTYREGLEIDRKDNNQGYHKNNCHWTTRRVNSLNRRDTLYVETVHGRMLVADAAEFSGLKWDTIKYRAKAGWRPEDIFREPYEKHRWNRK